MSVKMMPNEVINIYTCAKTHHHKELYELDPWSSIQMLIPTGSWHGKSKYLPKLFNILPELIIKGYHFCIIRVVLLQKHNVFLQFIKQLITLITCKHISIIQMRLVCKRHCAL